ncbi:MULTISPECIES: DUF6680 family protein [Acidipropionibacterium]|uniref:DUF6680 family protein n=1 Tax=Acidipropionibacterium TaxID=1912215 RepID=UPI0012B54046|nr:MULTISPECIES: DUF6680 family protein [Acidipropionibacterium]
MDAAVAGIVGAIAGGVIGAIATLAATVVSGWLSARQARNQARVALVREIMRYRGDQKRLVDALNEIPLMFGHDAECVRLLRSMTGAASDGARTNALRDLIIRLAKLAKINKTVTHSDITTPLSYVE